MNPNSEHQHQWPDENQPEPHDHDLSEPKLVDSVEESTVLIREGIDRYGDPFLAYLVLDGVEQRSADLLEQFVRRYRGYFPDRDAFICWALERSSLEAERRDLQREQGMWEGDLVWNLETMWDHMRERYAVTERLGGVHVFAR